MNYIFQPMTQEQAELIAYQWKYQDEYSFYDISVDPEDLQEFLDEKHRADSFFVVYRNYEMMGYFVFDEKERGVINIALGLKPELTGKGEGIRFLQCGMKYAQTKYAPVKITLSVAAFNTRAIKVYERAGFEKVNTYIQETNGGKYEFINMCYFI
ncbi:GNAT family protein [Paenibacillus chibensis]|uniref:GNAT family protein n=1 Tax=Paenibacillus chibensis TaxID=59846 RepID=A0ABU6PPF9_9BACL|nr:GNAT family protein [Paenibacillus chibensis]